ncbi:MAG: hypothetical protein ACT4P6_02265 [Gemmatimonadaceae bacterium]
MSSGGAPDEYVAVTCRLTGGGARSPFSLTDVRVDAHVELAETFRVTLANAQRATIAQGVGLGTIRASP